MSVINTQPIIGSSGNQGTAGYNLERSLRFRSSASAYLSRTQGTPAASTKFTYSCWVKRGTLGGFQDLLGAGTSANTINVCGIYFDTNNKLSYIDQPAGSPVSQQTTNAIQRDCSAWYHVVCAVDTTDATAGNRVKLYVNGVLQAVTNAASYTQNASTFLNTSGNLLAIGAIRSSAAYVNYLDGYLSEVRFIDGQALTPSSFGETDTMTGVWKPKRYAGTYGTNGFYLPFRLSSTASYAGLFNGTSQYLSVASSNALQFGTGNYTAEMWILRTSQGKNEWVLGGGGNVFQLGLLTNGTMQVSQAGITSLTASTGVVPLNQWTHIAVVKNSGTLTYYINGVASGTATDSLNYSTGASTVNIGTTNSSTSNAISGYLSNVRVVKGSAVYTSAFTPSTGPLTAITNTSLLTLQDGTIIDNSTNNATVTNTGTVTVASAAPFMINISADASGNGNNWTANNISLLSTSPTYDSVTDVPTLTNETSSNYCTLSPLDKNSSATVTNGNLTGGGPGWSGIKSTIGMSSGKWYCEITQSSGGQLIAGITTSRAGFSFIGSDAYGWGYGAAGTKYTNGSGTGYGSTVVSGDVIGIAFDQSAGTLTFYKNNTSLGTAFTGLSTSETYFFSVSSDATTINANFGQQGFKYTPPTGYKALNTYNLPDSTILAGNSVMDSTLYAGTNATRTVTNSSSFQPDFVWIKNRSSGSNFHMLFDSVRGVGKSIYTNATSSEGTNPSSGYLSAFASNGFTVTAGTTSSDDVNGSGYNYVGWQWKAGQGTTSSNTSGSITSTVSVNASAGFSVVTYTGTGVSNATVGHGLGVTPAMVIVKNRASAAVGNWRVNHKSLPAATNIALDLINAQFALSSGTGGGVGTLNNSSTFTLANGTTDNTNVNQNGVTYVAYCWSEIAGFSKFGSYTGNGSTDGPFVYTGFKPKFILTKRTDNTSDWWIQDTARATYNASNAILFPNLTNAEYTTAGVEFDILSNGFKPRNTGHNISTATYIYVAFAENPFKNSLAR